jgi:putative aminopeptidase FrvX
MNNGLDLIISKVMEYSSIPSVTYREKQFLEYLAKEMPTKYHSLINKNPKYLFYRYSGKTRWLVLAHIDRIPVQPFTMQVQDNFLTGQLDNVISVAICRYLMEQGTPVDFLFTTQEESCDSADQIVEAYEQNADYNVIDMDIDVPISDHEVAVGAITLRSRDNLAPYDKGLVRMMRKMAQENDIDYIRKDGHWLVCQIGTAIKKNPALKGMYLGLPINNYHSNKEVINLTCIKNTIKLFDGIRKNVGEMSL